MSAPRPPVDAPSPVCWPNGRLQQKRAGVPRTPQEGEQTGWKGGQTAPSPLCQNAPQGSAEKLKIDKSRNHAWTTLFKTKYVIRLLFLKIEVLDIQAFAKKKSLHKWEKTLVFKSKKLLIIVLNAGYDYYPSKPRQTPFLMRVL